MINMKKLTKINEGTLWGNSIMRSDTGRTRKEDSIGDFFGKNKSIMLYKEGDQEYFYIGEALEIEKKLSKNGWRLPTIDDYIKVSDNYKELTHEDFKNISKNGKFHMAEFKQSVDFDENYSTIYSKVGKMTLPFCGWCRNKECEIIGDEKTGMYWIKNESEISNYSGNILHYAFVFGDCDDMSLVSFCETKGCARTSTLFPEYMCRVILIHD